MIATASSLAVASTATADCLLPTAYRLLPSPTAFRLLFSSPAPARLDIVHHLKVCGLELVNYFFDYVEVARVHRY